MDKVKVLFIAGNGRSGSTILHNILGQFDGFYAFGELRYIWERSILKNRLCGCGVPFQECQFWIEVMDNAFAGVENIEAKQMVRDTESFRIQNLPLTLLPNYTQKEKKRLQQYMDNLQRLYQSIQSTTHSRVIVDSSKNPSYGYILSMMPGIDLHVLHFMRDSRAVAYSWSKKKEFQPGDFMARKTPIKSALQWDARNLTTEIFLAKKSKSFMKLRYEDFIAHPQATVESIVKDLLQEPLGQSPFVTEHRVELTRASHSVFGNPVRFQNGSVDLQLDNKWLTEMNGRHKHTVSALTLPLQIKYGYFNPL